MRSLSGFLPTAGRMPRRDNARQSRFACFDFWYAQAYILFREMSTMIAVLFGANLKLRDRSAVPAGAMLDPLGMPEGR